MKILLAIPRLTYSGAPKMMAWVANQMALRGHDVRFVAYFSNEQLRSLHKRVKFHSLGIHQSKNRLVRNTLGMIQTLIQLDNYVRKERPDIFVSFLDSVGYMYLPIGKKRCKIVISERVDPYSYRGWLSKIRFKLMGFADQTVFQTDKAQQFFENMRTIFEKSQVIPNPVVLSESVMNLQNSIPEFIQRDNRIVTVGRLSLEQKRQDVLLQAFQIVHQNHPEMQLVIYGDGQDRDKIYHMICDMGLANSVMLAGRTDFVERDILSASAFVITSDFEGIPNSLIEALSVGVPCVATDCSPGGAALLIDNGENGYLVPKGDVQQIADCICNLLENKEISEKFSRNGPKIIHRFSEKKIADLWERCFLNLK